MKKREDDSSVEHGVDCECCANGMDAYLKKLEDTITRVGHAIVGTMWESPAGLTVPMCYTVGLAEKGYPELLIFAVPHDAAMTFLNDFAERLLQGQLPMDTPVTDVSNLPLVCKIVAPEATDGFLNIANQRVGKLVPAIQVVCSDQQGVFPWSPTFDAQLKGLQPMLFSARTEQPHNTYGLH